MGEVPKKTKKAPTFNDDELARANAKLEKRVAELTKENDALREELEALRASSERQKKEKVKEVASDDSELKAKIHHWKTKFEELSAQHVELEEKHITLDKKVALLLEKLRKYGGEEAVKETLQDLQLEPPGYRRKLKAWERLYKDAVRRIDDFRTRERILQEEEARHLRRLKRALTARKDSRANRQVEALIHLHKAKTATDACFHDALSWFHETNPGVLPEEILPVHETGKAYDPIAGVRPEVLPGWWQVESSDDGLGHL